MGVSTTDPAIDPASQRGGGVPPRRGRPVYDAVTLLSVFAVIQIVLPARYVVGPLGGAGAPARLFGLVVLLWWITAYLHQPWPRRAPRQPLRWALFLYLAAVWASYLVATLRPASSIEQLPADRGLLNMLAWASLALAGIDGVSGRARLDTLLRRLALLGGLEGVLGLAQFLTGQTFVEYLHLPGLVDSGSADTGLLGRGSFYRPTGTAVHPIELGVTLSMLLPIALHYAIADRDRSRVARWFPVVTMGALLPLSVSRSAVICALVALLPLLVVWPPRLRRRVCLAAVGLVGLLVAALPGLLSTFVHLFAGVGQDTSTQSRTDSYGVAWSFIRNAPLFGRGVGTFLPRYRILDNQYLGSAIELGLLGLAALAALFAVGVVTAWRARAPRVPGERRDSHLGPALAAALASGAVSFAFFDAFAFPIVPSLMFLLLGCAGALHRVDSPAHGDGGTLTVWQLGKAVRRHPVLAGIGMLATLIGSGAAATATGLYYQQAQVVLVEPPHPGTGNGFTGGSSNLVAVAGLLSRQMDPSGGGPLALAPDATIIDMGITDGVWVRLPNRGGQWATNFDRAELDVQVAGTSPEEVRRSLQETLERIRQLLRDDQLAAGATDDVLITMGTSPSAPPVLQRHGSPARAGIAALPLGLGLTLTLVLAVDRRLPRRHGVPRRQRGGSRRSGDPHPPRS